jgi:hypothetical protein
VQPPDARYSFARPSNRPMTSPAHSGAYARLRDTQRRDLTSLFFFLLIFSMPTLVLLIY